MTAPHPGEILRSRIAATGMNQEQFGKLNKGIHWVTLNRLIKGHEKIGPQYALILGKMLSTPPQYWLHLQTDYDLELHLATFERTVLGKRQKAIIERTKVMD